MDDERIVELYWARSEDAIAESAQKYGRYCGKIAMNILGDRQDADECVNDTWMQAWRAIPPHRPSALAAFLGKITRRLSLNRYRDLHAGKRGGGEVSLVLDELAEVLASPQNTESQAEFHGLTAALNRFLSELSGDERDVFVSRYWYCASYADLCRSYGFSESKVKSMLHRTRRKLREKLHEEGWI